MRTPTAVLILFCLAGCGGGDEAPNPCRRIPCGIKDVEGLLFSARDVEVCTERVQIYADCAREPTRRFDDCNDTKQDCVLAAIGIR